MLQDFLPCEAGNAGEVDDPLLSVKVTSFACGGVAIGMCISHNFADMATFCTFINNWAARSREIGNELELEKYFPIFGSAHLFPTTNTLNDRIVVSSYGVSCVLRVFLFKGTAITKLRGEFMSARDNITRHRPSKVQLIVVLLWKALVGMEKANGQSKACFVSQVVNLRNVVVPKAPENFCGNFISFANARIELSEVDNIDLQVLLELLHDSTNKIRSNNGKDNEVLSKPFSEHFENTTANDVNVYTFSSWCKFSFYSADFGWGKPVWRSITNIKFPNIVYMLDDEEGDGVEAWVYLDKNKCASWNKIPIYKPTWTFKP